MDRQKEIALALSACPPSVASKAAVYVLDRAGYIKVRDGENGFTAIVQCNGLENLDKKLAFLKWWAALKMKESQCPERARVTHLA